MNFADTLRGLWRRWYIVLPGTLITASLAFGAWYVVPPGYERSSTQLLIPGADSMPEGANPYLFLGGLAPAADVLVRAVGAANVQNEVVAEHPGAQIEVSRDTTTAGPVIRIVVTAASDAAAKEVLEILVERTAAVLEDLQKTEAVTVRNRVTVLPITIDSESVLQQRSRIMAVGAAGLVGLTLTLFVAGLVDGFSLQRKRREGSGRRAGALPEPPLEPFDASSLTNPAKAAPKPLEPSPVFDQSSYDDEPVSPLPSAR